MADGEGDWGKFSQISGNEGVFRIDLRFSHGEEGAEVLGWFIC